MPEKWMISRFDRAQETAVAVWSRNLDRISGRWRFSSVRGQFQLDAAPDTDAADRQQ
jgi:hypothetical protein